MSCMTLGCIHILLRNDASARGSFAAFSRTCRVVGLLAVALGMLPGVARAQGCPLPSEYTHSVSTQVGDILVTLATAQDLYSVGDPITFRLSFENTGTSTQVIPNPGLLSPLSFLVLLPVHCDSLEESGCYWDGEWLFRDPPGGWFFFGSGVTLDPGECWPVTRTWNGVPRAGGTTPPGLYWIYGGAWSGGEIFLPDDGVRLMLQIGSTAGIIPTPVETTTWGRLKSRYP